MLYPAMHRVIFFILLFIKASKIIIFAAFIAVQ